MSTIRILPDQVANRIAAGEVVERPVAVVKELVDNSIDAGADRISIQFKQGGKSYILVEDNGKGMTSDDALLCIERHATSKIQNSEDLFNIQTLGFRGEAIPSIASVSRFLLRTKQKDAVEGTEILINGGKLIHRKDVGMPEGTRIEVTHLFSSMPARRKFLKTDNTEASHIIQWIRLIAIAHPQVGFRLQSNQRTLISLPVHKQFLDRITALWGKEMESQLLPFEIEAEGIKGHGYISKAGVSRPSRQDIVTIVNGRPVESRTLGFAFAEAYHTHIPKGRYPVVFMRMEIDPTMVDVNIHPSKKEIKFKNEAKIRTLLIQTVWDVLRPVKQKIIEKEETSSFEKTKNPFTSHSIEKEAKVSAPQSRPTPLVGPEKTRSNTTSPSGRVVSSIPRAVTPSPVHERSKPVTTPSKNTSSSKVPQSSAGLEREWRFIGDYSRSYSLFERSSGLTLIHNNRAMRRIDFEKILSSLKEGRVVVQRDMVPVTFELDVHLSSKVKKLVPNLKSCGIEVEEFGRNFYRVEEIPAFLEAEAAKTFVLDWLREEEHFPVETDKMQTQIAQHCCRRNASNLQLPLNAMTAMDVLKKLLGCEQPMVDPEGKPVVLHLPHRTFENFKVLEKMN